MYLPHLITYIIIPTLKKIPNGYSWEAIVAIIMIIAHESRGGYFLVQKGGPALGPIQMEPKTHFTCWRYGNSIWKNALIVGIITEYEFNRKIMPDPKRLIHDLVYNVFMARQRLFMKPKRLPIDQKELSRYLKKHWNTVYGSAKELDYYNAFISWDTSSK